MIDDPRGGVSAYVPVVFAAVLVLAAGATAVALTGQDATGDGYTEVYLLGPDGEAGGYPTELTVGETGTFVVGITNREGARTEYTIVVTLAGEPTGRESVTLRNDRSWERRMQITPETPGTKRVQVELYVDDDPTGPPDDRLYFRTRVTES